MTTGHEPWLEPDPQVGQDGHIKDHKNWRNWFKQFWEDVEAGNYPGLIGPEGPQGPVGPDGPPGEDGEAYQMAWRNGSEPLRALVQLRARWSVPRLRE